MGGVAFEELEHTADWALKVRGRDLADLLINAAMGMMELAGVRPAESGGEERQIKLESLDRESLLVDWLHEVLLALEMEAVAYSEIKLQVEGDRGVVGKVIAVPLADMTKQIKAVTYNDLQIDEGPEGLTATVVFDV